MGIARLFFNFLYTVCITIYFLVRMKFVKKLPIILLGLMYVIFSAQFFIMIMTKAAMPMMSNLAIMFMTAWFVSGFVFITKSIELVGGFLLLVPRTRALALIIMAPMSVGIFLTELLIVKSGFPAMLPAVLILVFNVIGIYQYRAKYLPMVR